MPLENVSSKFFPNALTISLLDTTLIDSYTSAASGSVNCGEEENGSLALLHHGLRVCSFINIPESWQVEGGEEGNKGGLYSRSVIYFLTGRQYVGHNVLLPISECSSP